MFLYKLAHLNPLVTSGLPHPYHLDESTFIFRGVRSSFSFFVSFFDEINVRKQKSPIWGTAFCSVISGAILFAYVVKKGARLIWVNETKSKLLVNRADKNITQTFPCNILEQYK